MTRLVFAAVAAAVLTAPAVAGPLPKAESCFGTKVDFVDSPKEAAALAKKEEKLVFVLHVSGNFEDPRFT
jgi:hypothetical protein